MKVGQDFLDNICLGSVEPNSGAGPEGEAVQLPQRPEETGAQGTESRNKIATNQISQSKYT